MRRAMVQSTPERVFGERIPGDRRPPSHQREGRLEQIAEVLKRSVVNFRRLFSRTGRRSRGALVRCHKVSPDGDRLECGGSTPLWMDFTPKNPKRCRATALQNGLTVAPRATPAA